MINKNEDKQKLQMGLPLNEPNLFAYYQYQELIEYFKLRKFHLLTISFLSFTDIINYQESCNIQLYRFILYKLVNNNNDRMRQMNNRSIEGGPFAIDMEEEIEQDVRQIRAHRQTELDIQILLNFVKLLRVQLPNMPHKSLLEIVFSPNHDCLLLLQGNKILAGICYCEYYPQRMFELTLMASVKKGKGYGSRLMNHFKCLAQMRRIEVITTQADNLAIGFYQKMGFSTQIYRKIKFIGKSRLDNATIMQTRIKKGINYPLMKRIQKQQAEFIAKQFKKAQILELNKISHSNQPEIVRQQYFKINPNSIPGFDFFWKEYKLLKQTKQQKIYRLFIVHLDRLIAVAIPQVRQMNSQLRAIPYIYYDNPIDLKYIQDKAFSGQYEEQKEMAKDIEKLFENCRSLYWNNKKIMDNIDELQEEFEIIQKEMQQKGAQQQLFDV